MSTPARRITLEVPVTTVEDARAADGGGADRLELCCALDVGGLTPTPGLVRAVKSVAGIPVWALIRVRPGGFLYSAEETEAMLADARAVLDAGADGIVVGCLTRPGAVDAEASARFVEVAGGRAAFHRAFDFVREPRAELGRLVGLGFRRVLTSGGRVLAAHGTPRLRALVGHAARDIEVVAAGGVRPENVAELLRGTGCRQVHASLRGWAPDAGQAEEGELCLGMGTTRPGWVRATDVGLVQAMRQELDRFVSAAEGAARE